MDPSEQQREPPAPPLPPDPPRVLTRRYADAPRQRGGTLIAEDVRDRTAHARRMCTPDGYRPPRCPRCGYDHLHVHDYTERKAFGEPGSAPLRVIRYQCGHPECLALWRVLPAFVARFLWYAWPAVEGASVLLGASAPPPPPPPPPPRSPPSPVVRRPARRTRARWRSRLATSARLLVAVLAALATPAITTLLAMLAHALDATRAELVLAYARAFDIAPRARLAALAGHIHRAAPGVRLM